MNIQSVCSRYYRQVIVIIIFCLVSGLYYCHSYHYADEPSFVIVVPSYNNEQWCEKNIQSLMSQKYSRKRIIFIDDCSSDDTFNKVKQIVDTYGGACQCTLIKNRQRCGALENIFYAVHSCANHEIIVLCDGDDWLYDEYVLEKVAHMYKNLDIWLTFGQFKTYPEGHWGICRSIDPFVIKNSLYRKAPWVTSHLRTFKAGLFKKIAIDDLQRDGIFFDVAWDMAMLFPMLEMAAGRILFISDLLYIYNQANPLNDFKLKMARVHETERIIRQRPCYDPIKIY